MLKNVFITYALLVFCLASFGQLGGIGKKLLKKADEVSGDAVSSVLDGPHPITTSYKDVEHKGEKAPDEIQGIMPSEANMFRLQRTPNGGFVLQEGFYWYQAQSFCLKAG